MQRFASWWWGTSTGSASPPTDGSLTLDDLQDFDVLLFSGQDYWFSYLVEWATRCPISHVAIVIRSPIEIAPGLTGLYLFESGYEGFPDAVEDRIKWGVQITDLKRVCGRYPGRIFQRRVTLTPAERQGMRGQLAEIYRRIADAPYDYRPDDLLRADLGLPVGNCQRTDRFFCSAFVTYLLAQFELVAPLTRWDLITPKDYAINWLDTELRRISPSRTVSSMKLLHQPNIYH